MRDLSRLLRPASIAVVGGGAWCASVVEQCSKIGYDGPVWPVHPARDEIAGRAAFASLDDLPGVPDAVFIGVNRETTLDVVARLSAMGAGGAVCFASGFREMQAETGDGDALQARLLEAAGAMPILGPNCYGFINYLDGALLWPDQHGGQRVDSGVAILTQSSNIAINLSMQTRGLPIAYLMTAGNQAQLGLAQLGRALLADSRVTALGLHIEGIGDLAAFETLAQEARALGKPIVALKAGKSEQARAAAISHTASLAGSDAGARALLARLGVAQVEGLPALLETLKLLHLAGPLPSNRIVSLSCSGGEASLMADSAVGRDLVFPALDASQIDGLRAALGPRVALANPLDYHTFIWGDVARMTDTFAAMLMGDVAMGCVIVDFPRPDRCDPSAWDCVIEAGAAARARANKPLAILSTLPETLPEAVIAGCLAAGLIPLVGLGEGLTAIALAARLGRRHDMPEPILPPGAPINLHMLSEAEAKHALAGFGLSVPASRLAATPQQAAHAAGMVGFPVVLKGQGLAHKSEAGLVALNLTDAAAVANAAAAMDSSGFLIEAMVTGGVVELLVGVLRDPAHGFVLTLAAGGILTEVMADSQSLLLPVQETDISDALKRLRIAPLLAGYRGKPGVDIAAIAQAVMAVQAYVIANAMRLDEIEINPLICGKNFAIAADALIRIGEDE
ncbi:Acyl-CoA synthetase (NDP forming) [Roseovarius lutimaris]|uniref:Acyl-CoA synthetase (NDP forming) n=1 Tax=Roseovarius lutimaris TaxID=1005928 RepID=A0A1I5GLL6_9RHOB|nr:acetate--CoA ligase family protein [Roseovarius lutimaris]SFO36885.1 Acyl-CoA synthetase (NDP forming) [Roseovarius lutimaris]